MNRFFFAYLKKCKFLKIQQLKYLFFLPLVPIYIFETMRWSSQKKMIINKDFVKAFYLIADEKEAIIIEFITVTQKDLFIKPLPDMQSNAASK